MRGRKRQEGEYWQSVSYIASDKRILLRVLWENGCIPGADGRAFLQTLLDRFREFINSPKEMADTLGGLSTTSERYIRDTEFNMPYAASSVQPFLEKDPLNA